MVVIAPRRYFLDLDFLGAFLPVSPESAGSAAARLDRFGADEAGVPFTDPGLGFLMFLRKQDWYTRLETIT